MPTYEYVCKDCEYEFEAFQSMKDDALTKCPECGKDTLKRKIGTGAGIIFKGSGFYETDYKRGSSYKEAAKKDSTPPPASTPKKEAKSSTKDK